MIVDVHSCAWRHPDHFGADSRRQAIRTRSRTLSSTARSHVLGDRLPECQERNRKSAGRADLAGGIAPILANGT